MPLTLMYITNRKDIAVVAQNAGVDRIWVDMEYIGKEERQPGMDTVKSHHTIEDVRNLRSVVTKAQLLVRINPIHEATDEYPGSKKEIEDTIAAGADIIMLPMFKAVEEVKYFFDTVAGRVRTILLFETAEAVEHIEEIIALPGIDQVHIGLNDLHLAYKQKFMFQLLTDGTVERLTALLKEKNIKFGFGGIARIGHGDLPAELIMGEHYRLGSTTAILSRGFCNANNTPNVKDVEKIFCDGVSEIRRKEREILGYTPEDFAANREEVVRRVEDIVRRKSI